MGTRKVLGMVGWYGMIYSPTPLLVADVVEYQYIESRVSYRIRGRGVSILFIMWFIT